MPANSSGLFTGYLMGKYPGRVGWLLSPDGWREPFDFIPYALDNGAYPVFQRGGEWDEAAFYVMLDKIRGRTHRPRWVAVPDVVADREKTLASWDRHAEQIKARNIPLAFVVQDGMSEGDVPADAEVIFVGGSTEWKWKNLTRWTSAFPRVHVGRVNTERMLWMAHRAGAESCDGTGWFRGDQDQLAGLIRYLDQSTSGIQLEHELFSHS